MSGEWTTLGEYITIQGGYAYKSEDFLTTGNYQVLKIKNVRFGHISYKDTAFINESLARTTEAWQTREGDILISMTGSGPNAPESLVGRVARVWKNEPAAYINQRVGRVKLKKLNSIHSDFIFYLLSQKSSQEYLVNNSSGSANQANINGKTIESVPCPRIDFYTSQEVGRILRQMDEKIILNRQINQTLEAMAQALFKSWFVDFEPVRAKVAALELGEDPIRAAMRAISGKADDELETLQTADAAAYDQLQTTASLFPDEFEESELGMVPKGWEVGKIGEVCSSIRKSVQPKDVQANTPYIGLEHVPRKSLTVPVWGISDDVDSQKSLYQAGDVLFGKLRPYFHKVAIAPNDGICSTDILVIRPSQPFFHSFALNHLFSDEMISYVSGLADGTRMPRIDWKSVAKFQIVIPELSLLEKFEQSTKHIYVKMLNNNTETQTLTTLRDTLLPKLLSGELSVINSEVEAVAIS